MRKIITLTILFCSGACQQPPLPLSPTATPTRPPITAAAPPLRTIRPVITEAPTATPTLTPSLTITPTRTATRTHTPTLTFTRTPTPAPTISPIPTLPPLQLPITPSGVPATLPTIPPALITQVAQRPPATLAADQLVIGYSVAGRAISGRRFGAGDQALLLVGGMHGGWEANTVALINELIAHFAAAPGAVLPGVSLILIPAANPDGLVLGRQPEGRFNANNVDLNRNWACGWSPEAVWRDQPVDPGPRPFSEPETVALASFIEALRPAAALFYHSAADGIFAGNCRGVAPTADSEMMAAVLGAATGYSFGAPFTAYPVTGTAPSWVDSLGIPAADVELQSWTGTEFERNLRGIMALQRWLIGDPG
ncbi:MAG: DUF2817 domain-containing protein [Chloroflexi bacterium]|nr:DUF2817 domain-containing protein [Chloroflexota bacterium]